MNQLLQKVAEKFGHELHEFRPSPHYVIFLCSHCGTRFVGATHKFGREQVWQLCADSMALADYYWENIDDPQCGLAKTLKSLLHCKEVTIKNIIE